MLQATWRLPDGRQVPYRVLYSYPDYQASCQKKLKKMKRMARRSNFRVEYKDKKFHKEVTRIRNLYTEDGGRASLVELIGKALFYLDGGKFHEHIS